MVSAAELNWKNKGQARTYFGDGTPQVEGQSLNWCVFTKAVASTIQRPVVLRANADVLRGCLRTE